MIYFTNFRTAQPLKTKLCSLCTRKKRSIAVRKIFFLMGAGRVIPK